MTYSCWRPVHSAWWAEPRWGWARGGWGWRGLSSIFCWPWDISRHCMEEGPHTLEEMSIFSQSSLASFHLVGSAEHFKTSVKWRPEYFSGVCSERGGREDNLCLKRNWPSQTSSWHRTLLATVCPRHTQPSPPLTLTVTGLLYLNFSLTSRIFLSIGYLFYSTGNTQW